MPQQSLYWVHSPKTQKDELLKEGLVVRNRGHQRHAAAGFKELSCHSVRVPVTGRPRGAECDLRPTAIRKQTSTPQCKTLNSASDLNELGKDPEPQRKLPPY